MSVRRMLLVCTSTLRALRSGSSSPADAGRGGPEPHPAVQARHPSAWVDPASFFRFGELLFRPFRLQVFERFSRQQFFAGKGGMVDCVTIGGKGGSPAGRPAAWAGGCGGDGPRGALPHRLELLFLVL